MTQTRQLALLLVALFVYNGQAHRVIVTAKGSAAEADEGALKQIRDLQANMQILKQRLQKSEETNKELTELLSDYEDKDLSEADDEDLGAANDEDLGASNEEEEEGGREESEEDEGLEDKGSEDASLSLLEDDAKEAASETKTLRVEWACQSEANSAEIEKANEKGIGGHGPTTRGKLLKQKVWVRNQKRRKTEQLLEKAFGEEVTVTGTDPIAAFNALLASKSLTTKARYFMGEHTFANVRVEQLDFDAAHSKPGWMRVASLDVKNWASITSHADEKEWVGGDSYLPRHLTVTVITD